jgi:hypothetical protein
MFRAKVLPRGSTLIVLLASLSFYPVAIAAEMLSVAFVVLVLGGSWSASMDWLLDVVLIAKIYVTAGVFGVAWIALGSAFWSIQEGSARFNMKRV